MKTLARLSFVAAFGGSTLAAALASAHVRLVYPTPRYPSPTGMDSGANIKAGPCGNAGDSRTTDASRVTVLEPGATITVQFNETINHPGFFRISFDDDGQDAFVAPTMRSQVQTGPTFTLPVLLDNIADKAGGAYTAMVTLPNVECERCTLQLIQVMVAANVNMWDASPDQDIYYTCADIALRRAGGMGGMGGTGAGGAGPGGSTGQGGTSAGAGGLPNGGFGGFGATAGSATGGTATGGTATGGVATGGTATAGSPSGGASTGGGGGAPATGGVPTGGGAPGTGATNSGDTDDTTDEEGGCRMAPSPKGGHAFLAAAVAALAIAVRRRRGSRSSAA